MGRPCQNQYSLCMQAVILGDVYCISFEVDHIIPLISDAVCGLLCWDNLQLLEVTLNASKNNNYQQDWYQRRIIIARRKKPDSESVTEADVRHTLEIIADNATRSEKVSWDRKMDNMVKLLAKLKPIEEQIMDLMAAKAPIIDEVQALRHEMVRECVHPFTHLTVTTEVVDGKSNETVACKFCDRKFGIRSILNAED